MATSDSSAKSVFATKISLELLSVVVVVVMLFSFSSLYETCSVVVVVLDVMSMFSFLCTGGDAFENRVVELFPLVVDVIADIVVDANVSGRTIVVDVSVVTEVEVEVVGKTVLDDNLL